MDKPQFNRDSWYGVIGDTFTTHSLRQVASGITEWMHKKELQNVLIGYDTRFGGKLFAKSLASTFSQNKINSSLSSTYVTTAAVILNVVKLDADIGIMVTGGEADAEMNGLKLIGVQTQEDIDLINTLISENVTGRNDEDFQSNTIPMENYYIQYLRSEIDFDSIEQSGLLVIHDAMYGASQSVFNQLLPISMKIRCEINPSFKGESGTMTIDNFITLTSVTKATEYATMGFALNSDASKLFMCDENGQQIDPYAILKKEKHVPWRDGLYIALKILEKMAKTGRKLSELQ